MVRTHYSNGFINEKAVIQILHENFIAWNGKTVTQNLIELMIIALLDPMFFGAPLLMFVFLVDG